MKHLSKLDLPAIDPVGDEEATRKAYVDSQLDHTHPHVYNYPEVYVNNAAGNDSNPGTSSHPVQTIAKAIEILKEEELKGERGGLYMYIHKGQDYSFQGSSLSFADFSCPIFIFADDETPGSLPILPRVFISKCEFVGFENTHFKFQQPIWITSCDRVELNNVKYESTASGFKPWGLRIQDCLHVTINSCEFIGFSDACYVQRVFRFYTQNGSSGPAFSGCDRHYLLTEATNAEINDVGNPIVALDKTGVVWVQNTLLFPHNEESFKTQTSSEFYINANTGDDSNDGLTALTAWKTMLKAGQELSFTKFTGGTVRVYCTGDLLGPQQDGFGDFRYVLPAGGGPGRLIFQTPSWNPSGATLPGMSIYNCVVEINACTLNNIICSHGSLKVNMCVTQAWSRIEFHNSTGEVISSTLGSSFSGIQAYNGSYVVADNNTGGPVNSYVQTDAGSTVHYSILPARMPTIASWGKIIHESSTGVHRQDMGAVGVPFVQEVPTVITDGVMVSPIALSKYYLHEWEFLSNASPGNVWIREALASGALEQFYAWDRIGVGRFRSSANANSGGTLFTDLWMQPILGGEVSEFIFNRLSSIASVRVAMGFSSRKNHDAPTQAAQFYIENLTLIGRTIASSTVTNTASTFTLVANTWYRGKIEINAAKTIATFSLYNVATGALLWTAQTTANLPNNLLGHGVTAWSTGTTNDQTLLLMDYMNYYYSRLLPNRL